MTFRTAQLIQATAIVSAVFYVLCYGFVMIAPHLAWEMTGHMLHTDLSGMTWSTSLSGAFMGLVCLVGLMCLLAGAFASTYNELIRTKASLEEQ